MSTGRGIAVKVFPNIPGSVLGNTEVATDLRLQELKLLFRLWHHSVKRSQKFNCLSGADS